MRHLRIIFPAVFGLFLAGAFLATRTDAQPGTMKQVVPGVWFREGELEDRGHCNNVVIEMKDYLIVVDANFPSGAKATMADIKKVSQKPVKYVFDTHHHGDHAYGNPVWTKAGATTLAYIGVVEEMKRYEPARWQKTAKSRKDVGELNLDTVEPPKETFSKTPYVLDDGSRRVEFHHFGWAHTRGDGLVYLPKEKVLCTGDAVVNGPYNATGDANLGNWPKVIQSAAKLNVDYVLPGHGGAGGKEIMAGQTRFLEELHKSVAAARKSGKKLEDLVTVKNNRGVSTTVTVPDPVKNWVGKTFANQVKDMYEELAAGKPHGDVQVKP